jgi:hypothetical protein
MDVMRMPPHVYEHPLPETVESAWDVFQYPNISDEADDGNEGGLGEDG